MPTLIRTPDSTDRRTAEQLRHHYEVETELAAQLRQANREERKSLYSSAYEELYRRVPDHPQLTRKVSPEQQRQAIRNQLKLLGKFTTPDSNFLEVGPGDCALTFEISKQVRNAWAVDVSPTITDADEVPENFKLIISDGCSIPVEANSIDLIYSNQLMEHLHPDDAWDQLKNIIQALSAGGMYLCITPNRLTGPHDISRYFDQQATGFHLREYTATQLSRLFKAAGFAKVYLYIGIKGRFMRFPLMVVKIIEAILDHLPRQLGQRLASRTPLRILMDYYLVGIKSKHAR